MLQTSSRHLPSASFSFTFQIMCIGRLPLGPTQVRGFWRIFPNSLEHGGDLQRREVNATSAMSLPSVSALLLEHAVTPTVVTPSMAVTAPLSHMAWPSAPAPPSPVAPGSPIHQLHQPHDRQQHTAGLPASSADRSSSAIAGDSQNLPEQSTIPYLPH